MDPILAVEVTLGGGFPSEIPVNELFSFPALFGEGTVYEFTRIQLIMFFAVLLGMALMAYAFVIKRDVVPGKVQAAAEGLVDFIRNDIAVQAIGKEGIPFVPFFTAVFLFVWLNNLFEIVPFVVFPPTAKMALPVMLALIVYVVFVVVGIVKQGPKYFAEVLFPPGVPKLIYLLVTPIELVSTFILRPLTLSVRLFANLLAGHIILAIIFLAIHTNVTAGPQALVAVVGLAAAPLAMAFELVVGILQAYIFTLLAAVYIGGAMHPEH